MELKIVCKRLITKDIAATVTAGESAADVIGITVPRYYGDNDLSTFSFSMTATAKGTDGAAEQLLTRDSLTADSFRLLWTVTSDFTGLGEEITLILVGTGPGGEVIKFKSEPITVGTDGAMDLTPTPTVSQQLWSQVKLEAQKAVSAAERAEAAAQTHTIAPATETALGGVLSGGDISVAANGTVNVQSVSGKTVLTNVPADAKFTDTVYTLPKATADTLGGVKVDGVSVTVNSDGVIAAPERYVLPAASGTALGGVKSGGDISVSSAGTVTVQSVGGKTLGANVPGDAVFTDTVYTLPAATSSSLGGVMVDGSTITVNGNGVISAVGGVDADGEIVLPKATETSLGAVMVDGVTITANQNGVITANCPDGYTLPAATGEALGGVKSGGDISVGTDGTVAVQSVGGKTVLTSVPANAVFTDTLYDLPAASSSALGGVKSGGDISVAADGLVTVQSVGGKTVLTDVPSGALFTDTVYTLPAASSSALGGVKSGGDISVAADGLVTVQSVGGKTLGVNVPANAVFTDTVYTLPVAGTGTLGGVKVDGTTVTATADGVISAASSGKIHLDKIYSATRTSCRDNPLVGTLKAPITNYDYLLIKFRNIVGNFNYDPQLYFIDVADIAIGTAIHIFKKYGANEISCVINFTFTSASAVSIDGWTETIGIFGLKSPFEITDLTV